MLNYKEEDKKLIENANYHYYDFTEASIKQIISKNIGEVTNEEWKILLQMIYPKNMIGSGLFQPILIFAISKNGKRKDPPLEVYNQINDLKDNDCLLFRIVDYIEKNSNLRIHNSWYEIKERMLKNKKISHQD